MWRGKLPVSESGFIGKQFSRWRISLDLPILEHDCPRGIPGDRRHIMRHHDDRRPVVAIESRHHIHKPDLLGGIETGRWFVENDDVRIGCEDTRECNALALALREVERISLFEWVEFDGGYRL